MEKIILKADIRKETGKEAVKKLRHQGVVPAVVYKGGKCLNIKVADKELQEVLHTKAGENVIVTLELDEHDSSKDKGQSKSRRRTKTAIIKEIQRHPVKENILHVDFNEISLTEVLTVKIPIAAKGEPAGAKEGGVLEHILWEIEVECLPTQIPENIRVDVSALKIGDSILVKQLEVPEGVKVLTDREATVVALAVPHVEEPEEVQPGEELVEPEVIMEKKPEEEEAAEEGEGGAPKPEGKEPGKEK